MPFAELETGRIYYEKKGAGKPLVLLHGAWASHGWWQWMVPALSRCYCVFSLDMKGHGRSDPITEKYTIDRYADDLDMFLQAVGIDHAVFAGWSMGGMISIQFSLKCPEKVGGLILIATRGHRHPGYKRRILFKYFHSRLMLLMNLGQPRSFDKADGLFPGEKVDEIDEEIRKMVLPSASKEALDWIRKDLKRYPRENFFPVIRSLWNWSAEERLPGIDAPALVLAGDQDNVTPLKFSRRLFDAIPHARLSVLENAGHCAVLEQPDIVSKQIVRFLEDIGYGPTNRSVSRGSEFIHQATESWQPLSDNGSFIF